MDLSGVLQLKNIEVGVLIFQKIHILLLQNQSDLYLYSVDVSKNLWRSFRIWYYETFERNISVRIVYSEQLLKYVQAYVYTYVLQCKMKIPKLWHASLKFYL